MNLKNVVFYNKMLEYRNTNVEKECGVFHILNLLTISTETLESSNRLFNDSLKIQIIVNLNYHCFPRSSYNVITIAPCRRRRVK